MKLISLSLYNIGLYRGQHRFDLSVHGRQNIVLFQGHNGAGKSTVFQALTLAFHGIRALGERVGIQQYNALILNRFHRYTDTGQTVVSDNAHVTVEFEYVESGRQSLICVKRQWQRNGSVVQEQLDVHRDGSPLAQPQVELQAWLNEKLAPGLASICFFDAEDMSALSDPDVGSPGTELEFAL